jgi:hypothetical protein
VRAAAFPGSALVPSAGEGVTPSRTFKTWTASSAMNFSAILGAGSSFRRDAETSVRDECAPRSLAELGSSQDVVDDVSKHVRQPVIAATVAVGQFFVIDTKEVQDGGVEIVNVNFVFHDG